LSLQEVRADTALQVDGTDHQREEAAEQQSSSTRERHAGSFTTSSGLAE